MEKKPVADSAEEQEARPAAVRRRTFLRGLAAAGAGIAGGSLLDACAPGSSSSGSQTLGAAGSTRGEVTLWQRDDDLFKVFKTVIPSFSKKYPNIKVSMLGLDVDDKLPATLISGTGVPDGSFYEDINVVGQAEHLLDLSKVMQPYRADTVQFKLDVNTVNGRLVGIPWDTDPGLLWYREDILGDAGVDPAKIATYDDLLNAARTIKDHNPSARPIPLEQDPNVGMQWLLMMVQQQQGTGLVDKNGNLTIETEAFHNALTWTKTVVDENLGVRQTWPSATEIAYLDNNTLSLMPWAIWFSFILQSGIKKSSGKWRVTQLPAWKSGGARSGVMGGSSFVIPIKAKNPHLAWLFYEYAVYNPEGYQKVFGPNSTYPDGLNTVITSVKSALKPQQPLFRPIPQMGDQNLWAQDAQAALEIPPGWRIPTWFDQAVNYLGSNFQQLMDGKMSVEDVISNSVSQIKKNLINRS